MIDKIEKVSNSLIHHGKLSKRIYLMHLDNKDANSEFVDSLIGIAEAKAYTKIFAKVPSNCLSIFLDKGFIKEALVKDFFKDGDGFFLGRFLDERRSIDEKKDIILKVLQTCKQKAEESNDNVIIQHNYKVCRLNESNVPDIVNVFKKVFKTYPFPIHNEDYIIKTMKENVIYFGVWDEGNLIAVSSCEMDKNELNAEMTDFATLEEHRGNSLASILLIEMERAMAEEQMRTLYTIARAYSFGMNITFAKKHYKFAGTLINNTNISGQIESMNVWYKNINA